MATLTPDQIKAKYQAAMPADLAEACNDFWHSIAYLNSKWADYRSLYNDAATVDLLNATAGVFFRDTQLMMGVWPDRMVVDAEVNAAKGVMSLQQFIKLYIDVAAYTPR